MADLDLDIRYGHYVDATPAEALASVNLMSTLGLHRARRGALVGHFAVVEVTSSPGSRRLAQAMRRTGAGPAAERFYDEHVEADAVHEQVVRREVVAGLLADEPHLEPDVAFGVRATVLVEDRLAARLLNAWRAAGAPCGARCPLRRGPPSRHRVAFPQPAQQLVSDTGHLRPVRGVREDEVRDAEFSVLPQRGGHIVREPTSQVVPAPPPPTRPGAV